MARPIAKSCEIRALLAECIGQIGWNILNSVGGHVMTYVGSLDRLKNYNGVFVSGAIWRLSPGKRISRFAQ